MKTRLFLSFPSALSKLSFSYRLPFRVQRYSYNITADLNRCYNSVKKWVNMKFHVYESGLFCASQHCSVCFSASSSCASQHCSVCFPATFLCASQLHDLVLLSIFAFFLPALIALLLGLNR